MNGETFRDSKLGFWSSHPRHVAKRTRIAAWITLIPVIVFGIVLIQKVRNPNNWLPLIKDAQWWFGLGAIVVSFVVATLMTLALVARMNRWQNKLKGDRLPTLGWVDPWMLVPAVVIAFIGPFYLAQVSGIGVLALWIFRFLAFLPLLGLILITSATLPPEKDDAKPRRQTVVADADRPFVSGHVADHRTRSGGGCGTGPVDGATAMGFALVRQPCDGRSRGCWCLDC